MKKFLCLLLFGTFSTFLFGCQKNPQNEMENPISSNAEQPILIESDTNNENSGNFQTYQNPKHGYSLQYPEEWFYLEDACCPPPPTLVGFSDVSPKQAELSKAQVEGRGNNSISILCLYETNLDEIGEVQLQKEEGITSQELNINGFSAIKFSKQSKPGSNSNVLTYYISNSVSESCRVTFSDACKECDKILNSFTF